jgi:hypothetical protein
MKWQMAGSDPAKLATLQPVGLCGDLDSLAAYPQARTRFSSALLARKRAPWRARGALPLPLRIPTVSNYLLWLRVSIHAASAEAILT